MTISATDIKMRQSQRLTDNPDGGGRMVQAEIVDGQMNNLFPDIGDEERTTGRATLRKMFVHVDTPGTDVLKDAIGVLLDPPTDPKVQVSMFATGSYSDVRSDARNRVESYITRGVESRYVLLSNHFIGQQALQFYCMKDAPSPDINDNLCLFVTAAGYAPNEQYVRVKSILSRSTRTFYDDLGAFERDVIIVETVTALLYDFPGQEAVRLSSIKPPTRIYETNVVEATSYHSVKRLTAAAKPGDLSVQVDTPYVTIVPTSTAETPVSDVLAGLGTISYVPSGPAGALALSFSTNFPAGIPVTRFLGTPMVLGSVKVLAGSVELSDDGAGNLTSSSASPWTGSVDYLAGSITLISANAVGFASVNVTARPAGAISAQGFSDEITVTQNNQGYNWLFQLTPLPAAGTVVVDYRALGKWIRLQDNGQGQLVGKPGQGSGSVNYATGAVVLTTGALPDLDSSVIPSWGTPVLAESRTGDVAIEPPALHFMLENTGIVPGSSSFTLRVGGSTVAVSDNGVGALLIGGVPRGSISYATGEVVIRPIALPDADSQVVCDYEYGEALTATAQPVPDAAGVVSVQIPNGPVRAGSLRLDWLISVSKDTQGMPSAPQVMRVVAKDDGKGNVVGVQLGSQAMTATLGSINYATGALNLQAGKFTVHAVSIPLYQVNPGGTLKIAGYTRKDVGADFSAGTMISLGWMVAGAAQMTSTETLPLPPVQLLLTPTISDSIVPGSLRFTYKGRTYVDRNGGLYYNIDPMSGAGVYGGAIDYSNGAVTLTQWVPGGTNVVTVQSLLTRIADHGVAGVYFRAPGSPLRPGVFTLRAVVVDGTQLAATADVNGNISGPQVAGTIDWETGVAKVAFGQLVPMAGNEGAPWFDPAAVVGDQVWKPTLVLPGTVYIGAVVFRSIPLSAVVIGLESVRLPADGRVPAFKSGQTVLIHHTAKHSIASPQANQVVPFGRTHVAAVEVVDAAGTPVDSAWYEYDLQQGRLTFSDPLNLSAYQLPIVVSHRVEDRRLVVQPQITGEIEINTGLTHDYPPGEALISTALRLGEANGSLDLQARVVNLFDQSTWTNSWTDQLVGSAAPGTYNDTDFPLLVTNSDTITERWAIRFTNATQFEVIGETVGVITTGSISADCAPLNPRTNRPYFTIRRQGWGTGWATNNVVRFNTVGGLAPVWMVRTTLPGAPEGIVDSTRFMVVGNISGDNA
ncbi:hypothetical protein [Stenotrophomonas sp. CFBP8994]|uniref:hypothetical protein n=1 Tax=Stenotrophomonas sp. CFBP8994 TaxID=3096527 RepID=UPI002A6A636B|nr:hypothetical protein [Stenotrophomonas sp. CFBP8994]MDY0978935.1 hypothetical protein [Stenotrophomonas sp. CFBP8994]